MLNRHILRASWGSWMTQTYTPVGPAWLQSVWTAVFSAVIAAGFTVVGFIRFAGGEGAWRNLAGWAEWYFSYLVVSLAIGFSIHGLFYVSKRLLGRTRIGRFTAWQRLAYFSVLPIAGVLVGNMIGMTLLGFDLRDWIRGGTDSNAIARSLLFALLAWLLFTVYFTTRAQRIRAERNAAQAQLQLLQAQMEPHFLFNTLANVVSLMEEDTPRAKQMLESFTDYLRASLGSMRRGETTLGEELDLAEAYLRVVKTRMEDRLHYRIDVPDGLRSMTLPPLSLQPLIENAVVHGLEPQIDGGTVVISARLIDGQLIVDVTDDGRGLEAARTKGSRGTGTALANIRERLAQLHGERGGLVVEAAQPQGVHAVLRLPAAAAASL